MKIQINNPDSFFASGKPEEIAAIETATGVHLHKQSRTLWADRANDVWLALDIDDNGGWYLYLSCRNEHLSQHSEERHARLAIFLEHGVHSTPPMSA